MEVIAQDGGELAGMEQIVAELGSGEIDDKMVEATSRAIAKASIPLHTTMGVWDRIGPLINWFRGREMIKELPELTVFVDWFTCHVPHQGTAQVSIEEVKKKGGSVGLKLFGSGYERGRAVELKVASDSEPRTKCTTYSVAVRVRPVIYSYRGEESILLQPSGEAGTRVEAMDVCEYCARSPEDIDLFDFELGSFIDLTKDEVPQKTSIELTWTESNAFEVGVDLSAARAPLSLSVAVSTSKESIWKVAYELKPGFRHQPYRRLDGASYLPPMWAFCK